MTNNPVNDLGMKNKYEYIFQPSVVLKKKNIKRRYIIVYYNYLPSTYNVHDSKNNMCILLENGCYNIKCLLEYLSFINYLRKFKK